MVILKVNPMALKLPPPDNIEEKYYFFHIWQNVIYSVSEESGNFGESSLKMYPFENLPYCLLNSLLHKGDGISVDYLANKHVGHLDFPKFRIGAFVDSPK